MSAFNQKFINDFAWQMTSWEELTVSNNESQCASLLLLPGARGMDCTHLALCNSTDFSQFMYRVRWSKAEPDTPRVWITYFSSCHLNKNHAVIESQRNENFSPFNSWMSSPIFPSIHLPLFAGITEMNYLIIWNCTSLVKRNIKEERKKCRLHGRNSGLCYCHTYWNLPRLGLSSTLQLP